MSIKMIIPSYIQTALDTLEAAGFEAYPVGGCVRDALLGKPAEDYDITTSAAPAQIKALFEGDYRLIESGMRHGTVAPIIQEHPVEITTFRIDGDYSDHRHPDSVHFSDRLEDDLSRRDFTMNAMAYSTKQRVIDYFGGGADIRQKQIRCVGAPDRRFEEDALRMLRALRFSAVLGFTVEAETAASIRKNFESIHSVSAERIYAELRKLLAGAYRAAVLRAFPCLSEVLFDLELSSVQLKALEEPGDYRFALAIIFFQTDPVRLKAYKPDNKTYRFVQKLHSLLGIPFGKEQGSPGALWRWMRENDVSREEVQAYISLRERLESDFCAIPYREAFAQAQAQQLPLKAAELALGGEKLQQMGYRGKAIGAALEDCIRAVLDGSVTNKKEALCDYLKNK